jgi:hypothetical protein
MTPIKFEGQNIVFGATQPEYQPLPALKFPNDLFGTVITCWELNDEEMEQVKKTGRIYLSQFTFKQRLQPILMSPDLSVLVESRANYE